LVNPAEGLTGYRVPAAVYRLPTPEQVTAVLTTQSPTLLGQRARAVLELLYSTGVRRSECCALDLHDVDLTVRTVAVRHTKGFVPRLVPLSPVACEALEVYVSQVRPHLAAAPSVTTSALFLSSAGTRLSPQSVRNLVRTAFAALDLRVSPHQLRHACATHLVAAGADLRQVQALLGHVDISLTVRYTHLTIADLHREHARTHPRSKRQSPHQT
jgi:site-specific recombinase XerD